MKITSSDSCGASARRAIADSRGAPSLTPVRIGLIAAVLAGASLARADIVYNESVMGDLSNSGLVPTHITLSSSGENEIWGTTGRSTGVDRDYFTVTIPWGYALTGLWELPDTHVGGAVSFIGMQWGNQVTLPTNTATAAGLLGWAHYGASSGDLFAFMEVPANGSSGFTAPLGPGDYSFWIQDFNPGSFAYGFDVRVSAVPEPSTYGFFAAALGLGLAIYRRRFGSVKR